MAHTAHTDEEMMKERFDSPREFDRKIEKLVKAIRQSKHFVVFTGAGISTDAGIPDFRGPQGVWTLKAQGKQRTGPTTDTLCAIPTATHMSLVQLQKLGICKYLISQNCDGLHRRSGIEPDKISELHGNGNIEYCETCGFEYLRDFHAYRIGRGRDHFTGRYCVIPNCGGRLMESTIDFGQSLPVKPLQLADYNSGIADVHLVLGSSLTVSPACNMPKKTAKKGGQLFICNLQKTPLDSYATEHIFQKCDVVMKAVMQRLGHTIPPFELMRHFAFKQTVSDSKWDLCVSGIEFGTDGSEIPASTLKLVEVKLPKDFRPDRAFRIKADPFAISAKRTKSKSRDPAVVRLHFMGHYCEPPVDVRVEQNMPSSFRLTMKYNPQNGKWTRVQEESQVGTSGSTSSGKGKGKEKERKDKEIVSESEEAEENEDEEEEDENETKDMDIAIQVVNEEDDEEEVGVRVSGRRIRTSGIKFVSDMWGTAVISVDAKGAPMLVACGGTGSNQSIGYLDIKSCKWTVRKALTRDAPKLPFVNKARWGHTATVLYDRDPSSIYLIAGWDGRSQYNDVNVYNCRTETLQQINTSGTKPSHRAGHTATAAGKNIIVFGGAYCNGGPYEFYNDVFSFDTETSTWHTLECMGDVPPPRAQHTATRIGKHLVVIGGFTGSELTNDIYVLGLDDLVWTKITPKGTPPPIKTGISMPDFRVYAARHTVVPQKVDGEARLVYYGPMGVYLLNPNNWTWTKAEMDSRCELPRGISAHSAVELPNGGGFLVYAGKTTDSNDLDQGALYEVRLQTD